MISQFQASSDTLERLTRAKNSINGLYSDKAEAFLEQSLELVHLFTQATLLSACFHTHHRQWRRKRIGERS
jgi:hypothetical protein